MIPSGTPLQTGSVMLRFIASRMQRKIAHAIKGDPNPDVDHKAFRDRLEAIVASAPEGLIAEHKYVYVPGDKPPWLDTGLEVQADDTVTTIAAGRVYMNKLLDIWAGPSYQLWARVGDSGEIVNGTRDTNTFTADTEGKLHLCAYLPGEWADKTGKLATPEEDYKSNAGGMSVMVIRWSDDALEGLEALAKNGDFQGLIAGEINRLLYATPSPEGWDFLWFLGPSEIYRDAHDPQDRPSIHCHTHANVSILQKDAPFPLTPDTQISWSWKVDQLPSDFPEITLPTHDYLSIAVEFDNGQDITYYWSAGLPVETIYRCPLPTWNHRETHVVIRSGPAGLGEWLDETRNIHDDCQRAYDDQPTSIVRIWLIANSVLQRKTGICEYANIQLTNGGETLQIV